MKRLRELCEKATEGPWRADHKVVFPPYNIRRKAAIADCAMSHGIGEAGEHDLSNAALIAASRTAMPLLLDVAEAAAREHAPGFCPRQPNYCDVCAALRKLGEGE